MMRVEDETVLQQKWYVVVDDLIGGVAIANVNKPCSQHDARLGEVEIGNFISEHIAKVIVNSHNYKLKLLGIIT